MLAVYKLHETQIILARKRHYKWRLHLQYTAIQYKKLSYPQRKHTSNTALSLQKAFDMLNHLGNDHECNRHTYGQIALST